MLRRSRVRCRWHDGFARNCSDALRESTSSDQDPELSVFACEPEGASGAAYAQAPINAGVSVDFRNFVWVTHEFFCMGAVLDEALQADNQAAADLKRACMGR